MASTLAEFLSLYGDLLRSHSRSRGCLLARMSRDPDIPRAGRVQATLLALEVRDRVSRGDSYEVSIQWFREELSDLSPSGAEDDESLVRRYRRAVSRWDLVGVASPLAPEVLRMPRSLASELGILAEISSIRNFKK